MVIYSDAWPSAHSKPARWTWPGFPVSLSQRWVTQEDRRVPTQVLSGDSPPFMIQDQVPLRLLGGIGPADMLSLANVPPLSELTEGSGRRCGYRKASLCPSMGQPAIAMVGTGRAPWI